MDRWNKPRFPVRHGEISIEPLQFPSSVRRGVRVPCVCWDRAGGFHHERAVARYFVAINPIIQ